MKKQNSWKFSILSAKQIFCVLALLFVIVNTNLNAKVFSSTFRNPKDPYSNSYVKFDSSKIEITPHGIFTEISTEFWFRPSTVKDENEVFEFVSEFMLDKDDFISDSYLWVGDSLVQAMIIDSNRFDLKYEKYKHIDFQDPSILSKEYLNGIYKLKIFPHIAKESRHAKYTYWTRNKFQAGFAVCKFKTAVMLNDKNENIPTIFKFYKNDFFTSLDTSIVLEFVKNSKDEKGEFQEFRCLNVTNDFDMEFKYNLDKPYFSKSQPIDNQQYYFALLDSKELSNNYTAQRINILIDFDPNRTNISAEKLIKELKTSILNSFASKDSINIMIGSKNTINVFDRWVPCNSDSINALIDDNFYKKLPVFSYLADLMSEGIKFNNKFSSNSSILLISSSEYAPSEISANELINNCKSAMDKQTYKISVIDFSNEHYSEYYIDFKHYYGNQYFNENISFNTKGEYFSIKNNLELDYMLNTTFANLKGYLDDIAIYVDAKDGLTYTKTTERFTDLNTNQKLIYEFGRIEGNGPYEIKLSAILNSKAVVKKYTLNENEIISNNESSIFVNAKELSVLDNIYFKNTKETQDMINGSIKHRILTTNTVFLCVNPWMQGKSILTSPNATSSIKETINDENQELAIEINYGPNPIESFCNIDLQIQNENTHINSITIYDLMGNQVHDFAFEPSAKHLQLEWNLDEQSKIAKGTYYLVINSNLGKKAIRLIVL